MEFSRYERYIDMMEILARIVRRLSEEGEISNERPRIMKLFKSAEIDMQLLKENLKLEKNKDILAFLLRDFVKQMLLIFIQLDKNKCITKQEESIFYGAYNSFNKCFFHEKDMAIIKAELMIQKEKYKNKMKNKIVPLNSIKKTRNVPKKNMKRNIKGLMSFVTDQDLEKMKKRNESQIQEKLETEILYIEHQLEFLKDSSKHVMLTRIPELVKMWNYTSQCSENDQITLLLDLIILELERRTKIEKIDDFIYLIERFLDSPPMIQEQKLPEEQELIDLMSNIENEEKRLKNIKAQLNDSSIDDYERRNLIGSKSRLSMLILDERYKMQSLKDRIRWKKSKIQEEYNAHLIKTALQRIKNELVDQEVLS
ncbi:MAG: hypothetical protein ACTSVI_04065 [Promethearchaeota archaeon]